MDDLRRHGWKVVLILILFGLAGRWDAEDSERIQAQHQWARVAQK